MSQTETHFGKLRKVEILNQTLEQWCEIKCKEVGNTKIESYYNSWQEQARDCLESNNKYFFVDDEVWEVIEHIESQSGDDIDIMMPNADGTITFVQQFYNGGTCLSECIEDGIKRIKDKQKNK
jgi:hypothetical protein